MGRERVEVGRCGPMARFIKASGKMIWPMVRESLGSLMVAIMKEISRTIDSMVLANLLLRIRTLSMRVSSTNTCNTATVHKLH